MRISRWGIIYILNIRFELHKVKRCYGIEKMSEFKRRADAK